MLELITTPLTALLARYLEVDTARLESLYAPPGKGFSGDLALPCFQLAPPRKIAPGKLAIELASVVRDAELGVGALATGPFVNLTFEPAMVATKLLPALVDPRLALRSSVGSGQTVCIDFSSPNIAKHLAFHHLRGTMIGNALAHCYAAVGYEVVRINFLGDWGTAFGRLVAGFEREHLSLADLERAADKVGFLNQLYVRISQAERSDETISEQARACSKKLEEGDPASLALWRALREVSLIKLREIYALLGVAFDSWKGESYYLDKTGPLLDELETRGLSKIDKGATVVDLSAFGLEKPALLRRSDGATFYATRDLAASDDRYREFAFARSLYVVDLGQSLHFREWFHIARLLERPYADHLRHVGFGVVLMWNDEASGDLAVGWAKGRTRDGQIMLLEDVLAEAVERARGVVAEKSPDLAPEEREAIARAVGIGAVVFNDLKMSRNNDVKFKFEDALSMQGETGPYLQYAHARLCSIERKFEALHGKAVTASPGLLTHPEEKGVLLSIARLRSRLEKVIEQDEPSLLAQALLTLASSVASWLTTGNQDPAMRILCPDPALSAARLLLVRAARGALGEGLRLLGLAAPVRM